MRVKEFSVQYRARNHSITPANKNNPLPIKWASSKQTVTSTPRQKAASAAPRMRPTIRLLLMLLMGIIQFSITFNNYIELTEAVRTGGRNFSISRSTASATPYSSTVAAIQNSAGNLSAANLTVTTKVNGTACSTDSGCAGALSTAAGEPSTVSATYPCNLTVMGFDYLPSCTLSSQTSDLVE